MTENQKKSFEIFPWNENFGTGIPLVDEQHQKLVSLLNQLACHLVYDETIELKLVFDELAAYADYHFKTEEDIWKPYFKEDVWLADHRHTHDSFLPEVLNLKEEETTKPFNAVIEDTIKFLIHWLAYHILENDKRMSIALHAIESGRSLEKAKATADEEMNEAMKTMIETVLGMYDKLASRTLDLMKEKEERKRAEIALQKSINEANELKKILKEKIEITQKQMLTTQKLAALGELSAGVSHEVLNPVNIISISSQMLQKKTKDNPDIQEFCCKVNDEIERIQKIMGALLEFSRMSEPKFQKGAVWEEIEKVVSLVEEEFKLENIKIERNWCSPCVEVMFDPDKIRQVYLNLIQNSRYAMAQGGTLKIGCGTSEKYGKSFHKFTISDTGSGMSDEVLSKIFQPFFSTKPTGEGTGMGLSVAHGIIHEHGGTIEVESSEGKGTTFSIYLPVA